MGKIRKSKASTTRDPGPFIALPWSVVESPAYAQLSHPARSLLIEIAHQYVRENNGRLLASAAFLSKRGWNSSDVIVRAKRELLAGGFIHETVKGHRPNKASWYALTWQTLDRIPGYDYGATETFERRAYRKNGALLNPSRGVGRPQIAPSRGVASGVSTPSPGAVKPTFDPLPTPSNGHHLDMPSPMFALHPTRTSMGRMLHHRLASRPFHLNRAKSIHLEGRN